MTAASIEWQRSIPVRYEADVAVIGGGMAGVAAAASAARSGAKVILIEQFAELGGNATIGGVANFAGETAGQGEFFDEILKALEACNAIQDYQPYPQLSGRTFHAASLVLILQEALLARGVKLLLHTHFVDALRHKNCVTECIVCGASGLEALRARQFVDATGEALLVHRCGFETLRGRQKDGMQLPMSHHAIVREVASPGDHPLPAGSFIPVESEEDLPMTSLWSNGPGSLALKVKIPMYDATDTESLTAAEIQARRRCAGVVDFYRRVQSRNWMLDHFPPRIGIREGRRIVGDYQLTVDDLRAGRSFDDGIARAVFYLDGHKPDDDKRTYILPKEQLRVPPYQIPFSSLVVKGAENLLVAGRCLSADQLALSSARMMPTCSMMGQAAGIAAAWAASRECGIHSLNYSEIRQEVLGCGAYLEVGEDSLPPHQ